MGDAVACGMGTWWLCANGRVGGESGRGGGRSRLMTWLARAWLVVLRLRGQREGGFVRGL